MLVNQTLSGQMLLQIHLGLPTETGLGASTPSSSILTTPSAALSWAQHSSRSSEGQIRGTQEQLHKTTKTRFVSFYIQVRGRDVTEPERDPLCAHHRL